MEIGILYLLIGLSASTVGAISGLGGGVIIKPVLDFFGHYDMATIGILSSCTVFSMAIVSLAKKFMSKATFEYKKLLSLSFGAIAGGFIGKYIFDIFDNLIPETNAKIIQSVLLALLMFSILLFNIFKKKIKTFNTSNIFICLTAGIVMGTISAFLGIGGGPVNVALIIILFSCNAKDAAIYSIFTIFFSQISTLGTTLFTVGFGAYDLSTAPYMIFGGIAGGFLGDKFSKKLTSKQVEKLFSLIMIVVICLNIINIVRVATI
ncbi:sulfite exporter TauE/SafE family protein [Candidatus Epulonipiscium viviparus]|uniref:sulfite exporter TauE/SafE family protein n=1 Tax=Candidatus Epulonipiscium viviparus TaxID=420336 RepID=UPI00016C0732|nr:sulfite exporter TauE/SafE family protein [Candidatus Epulopiscium viviparus]